MNVLKVCALVAVAALAFTPSAVAQGICGDMVGPCNDDYLAYESLDGVYSVHGYEYGCGQNDRQVHGSIRLAGGYAYFGLARTVGASGIGDYGNLSHFVYSINMSSKTGSGMYSYVYLSGVSITGHGGTRSFAMATCSPPGASATVNGVDISQN